MLHVVSRSESASRQKICQASQIKHDLSRGNTPTSRHRPTTRGLFGKRSLSDICTERSQFSHCDKLYDYIVIAVTCIVSKPIRTLGASDTAFAKLLWPLLSCKIKNNIDRCCEKARSKLRCAEDRCDQ